MRKKIILFISIFIIAIVAFIAGNEFSKYVKKLRGETTAKIATWNFKVNEKNEEIQSINLASTYNNDTLSNNKIAPGSEGVFGIIIDTTDSEVGIKYFINFNEEKGKPNNLKFIYEEQEYKSLVDLEEVLTGVITADDNNKTRKINIKWKWEYETGMETSEIRENDIIDTNDAIAIKEYKFNVIVSGAQIEPEKKETMEF